MATVFISAFLRPLIQAERVQLDGQTVGDLIAGLEARFPGAAALLLEDGDIKPGIAVVIDDQVGQSGLFDAVSADTEIHFLPALSGGAA